MSRVSVFTLSAALVTVAGACNPRSSQLSNGPRMGVVTDTLGRTVTDTITGLVWQRDGSELRAGCRGSGKLTCTWAEAKAYCASLALGGLSGWRLPAKMELSTIVDFTRTNPAVDPTVFPNTPSTLFWSSTPVAGSSRYAWLVHFGGGGEDVNLMENDYRVRCVR